MSDTPRNKPDPLRGMMEQRRADDPREYSDFEVQALVRELEQLRRMVAAQQARMQGMEEVAAADPMTGLANPRALEEELGKSLSTAKRYGRQHAIVVLEIEDFDGYEALGAELAGEVLRHVAGLVRQNIRPTDIAARLDGGTFAVILNELRMVENASMRAREIARVMAATPCIGKTRTLQLRVQVACVGFGADDDDVLDLLRKAQDAERVAV